jgi:hypothetical protein
MLQPRHALDTPLFSNILSDISGFVLKASNYLSIGLMDMGLSESGTEIFVLIFVPYYPMGLMGETNSERGHKRFSGRNLGRRGLSYLEVLSTHWRS